MTNLAALFLIGMSAGMSDLSPMYAAKTRAELVAYRQQTLNQFLEAKPKPNRAFIDELRKLDDSVEGREDLTWTIALFEAGRAYLREQKADHKVEAELLRSYAGNVGAREQYVRASALLRESFALLPVQDHSYDPLRAAVLKDYSGVLEMMGDVSAAEKALQEASLVPDEPTNVTHTLWTLADYEAKHQNPTAAEAAMVRLLAFLRSTPKPPLEALADGWQRVAMFYTDHGDARKAVDARWELFALPLNRSADKIVQRLSEVYEDAEALDDRSRDEVATKVLRTAESLGGEPLRISVLFELASSDLMQKRTTKAKEKIDIASRAVGKLGDVASLRDRTSWRIRNDDLLRALALINRGDEIHSTKPILRVADKNGEILSSPEPPPETPEQRLQKLLRNAPIPQNEAEAKELLNKLLANAEPEQQEIMKQMLADFPKVAAPETLKASIAKMDAAPARELDEEGWRTVQDAINGGQAEWAVSFLDKAIQREAIGEAHPFSIQEMMGSLLDALAKSQSWSEGRRHLAWWREFIGKIDHPESTRLFQNFEAEYEWEIRAGNPVAARGIWQDYVEFASRIMGPNASETKRLRSKAAQ